MLCLHGTVEHSWVLWFPVHRAIPGNISSVISSRILLLLCSSINTPGFHLALCMILFKMCVRSLLILNWHWPDFFFFFPFPPQVKNVMEQEGFSRQKRGYRNINDIEVNMSDPLFTKQWYLVSNKPASCLREAWPLAPAHIFSTLITQRPTIFPTAFCMNIVILC